MSLYQTVSQVPAFDISDDGYRLHDIEEDAIQEKQAVVFVLFKRPK